MPFAVLFTVKLGKLLADRVEPVGGISFLSFQPLDFRLRITDEIGGNLCRCVALNESRKVRLRIDQRLTRLLVSRESVLELQPLFVDEPIEFGFHSHYDPIRPR